LSEGITTESAVGGCGPLGFPAYRQPEQRPREVD
jgi:hypothetical protein